MGNSNLGYTIKYNTNGGSAIADAVKQTHIPSTFPTTTKAGFDFIGLYTDGKKDAEGKLICYYWEAGAR